ncbi:ABC a-pheromone efflux pump [Blumeria hordei DH14]|uniref:ABC a-pheromone efflux pump n=1 Tax=Blumeria graminis f. sp. hordei (strain DH14) TaxID=546991 RepID=N1J660_BLUG1|nr:ABC a-pheromone efflux pump [Blumeria hordei DH14]
MDHFVQHSYHNSEGSYHFSDRIHKRKPKLSLALCLDYIHQKLQTWISLISFTETKITRTFIIAITTTVVSATLRPVATIICGNIFEVFALYGSGTIVSSQMLDSVSTSCKVLIVLSALSWVVEAGFMSSWIAFGEQHAKEVRNRLFCAMLKRNIKWYDFRTEGLDTLLARIETQIREFQLGVSQPLGFILYEAISTIFSLGIAFYNSWQLTLLILINLPIVSLVLWLISRKIERAVEKQKLHLTQSSKYASTTIREIDTVKSYNGQDHELRNYENSLGLVTRNYLIQARANALQMATMKFVMILIFVEGFLFGLYLVKKLKNSSNIIVAFYSTLAVVQALEVALPQWIVLTKGISAEIAFMFFPAGKITYLVGRSGSGKSTIGKILMNYYAATSGVVLIDGNPTSRICQKFLRNNITMIHQDNILFNDSIYQNIALGRIEYVSSKDVNNAGEVVNLNEMLMSLPDGLNTMVGLRGKMLSGGQRQRVSIARSRLRDSPILILDEVTSALDQASRDHITAEIRKWRKGKTTIIITHDISQIPDDCYIYVLEKGSVIQSGFRRELNGNKDEEYISLVENYRRTGHRLPKLQSENKISLLEPDLLASRPKSLTLSKPQYKTRLQQKMHISTLNVNHMSLNPKDLPNKALESVPLKTELKFKSHLNAQRLPEISSELWIGQISTGSDAESSIDIQKGFHNAVNKYSPHETLHTFEFDPRTKLATNGNVSYSTHHLIIKIWYELSVQNKVSLVLGVVACFATAVATPMFTYCISRLMGVYTLSDTHSAKVSTWVITLIFLASIEYFTTYYSRYYLEKVAQAWVTSLRIKCLRLILAQPKIWLDNTDNSPSRLVEYLDRNAEEMRNLIGRFLGPMLTLMCTLSISVIWSLNTNWKLTLVALTCSPAVYVGGTSFSWISTMYETKCNEMATATSNIFNEVVSNIRAVRCYRLESYYQEKYTSVVASAYFMGLRRSLYSGLIYGLISDSISFVITALVVYYGGRLIVNDNLSVQDCIQVINFLLFGLSHGFAVLPLIPQVSAAWVTATKILLLLDLPQEANCKERNLDRTSSMFPIIFKNLSFTYPNSANLVLRGINLNVESNSCIAIIGRSGSGKSTIASLILTLCSPDPLPTPSLTFSGVPLEKCDLRTLRSFISIVPQDLSLFPDTIYANIIYGLPSSSPYANMEAAQAAAKQACIYDYIVSLERGFNTIVGEGSMGLSGGQIQRILIARALVRQPKLLILDEPTSALDIESAAHIRSTLEKLRFQATKSMAIIIISHNIELVAITDEVVVLEEGMVIEQGKFTTLWSKPNSAMRKISGEFGKKV